MFPEKEDAEDLPAFKIVFMNRYHKEKTTYKARRKTDHNDQKQYRLRKHQENKKKTQKTNIGRKTNINDKQLKSRSRKLGYV